MAETHTEIYRRFRGELVPHALRFVPLYLSDLRTATRKKLPLVLLFSLPAIGGIVFSFIVYVKFMLEEGATPGALQGGMAAVGGIAGKMIQVREQIAQFNIQCRNFALLAIAWYGAGLIANDRRASAHLLYFSRPISRVDYVLGHFLTAATFGVYAALAPTLLICLVATFTSPDFAFIRKEWDVVLATFGYGLLFVAVTSSLVLAISSLATRKAFALVGVFAVFAGSFALAGVISSLRKDRDWFMLSLFGNFQRLGDWMFDRRSRVFEWNPWWSLAIVTGLLVLSLLVVAWRVRRMEVVK